MSVEVKYWDTQEKLDKLCHENHLRFRFRADDYPIIFRFEPIWEKAAQMKFESDGFEGGEKRKPTDPEASIEMIFDDELIIQITNDFTIDDEILNKIKGMAKKLHYLYLHIWHKLKKQGEDWTTYTKEDPPPKTDSDVDVYDAKVIALPSAQRALSAGQALIADVVPDEDGEE